MFKVIVIGGLLYTLYRLVLGPKSIKAAEESNDDTVDIDYEEVD